MYPLEQWAHRDFRGWSFDGLGMTSGFDVRGATVITIAWLTATCGSSEATRSTPQATQTSTPCPAIAASTVGSTPAPPARGYHQMISLGSNGGVVALGGETPPPPDGGRGVPGPWKYPRATGRNQRRAPPRRTTNGPPACA